MDMEVEHKPPPMFMPIPPLPPSLSYRYAPAFMSILKELLGMKVKLPLTLGEADAPNLSDTVEIGGRG